MASEEAQWYWERKQCSQAACNGIRLLTTAWCLAHAVKKAPDAFTAELNRISAEGTIDARGVLISGELLEQLLEAVPHKDNRPTFTAVQFQRATFLGGEVHFGGASFQGGAQFGGASFHGDAVFGGARFQSEAVFGEATFKSRARFSGASFRGIAGFGGVMFQGRTRFTGASFHGDAGFSGTHFQDEARFDTARFEGGATFIGTHFQDEALFHRANFLNVAWFDRADFQREASFTKTIFHVNAEFSGATFHGVARFAGATFHGEAKFDGVTFEVARQFGPVVVGRQLSLAAATFKERVQIDAAAAAVRADTARFLAGGQLRLRWAQVVLDDADLAVPSILAGVPKFPGLDEHPVDKNRRAPGPNSDDRPRLMSVRRADVAGLTVDNVDLRACRFLGAHNLDKLRIEGNSELSSTPHLGGIPSRGWTTRDTIAEEQHWRSTEPREPYTRPRARRREGWYQPEHKPPDWLDTVEEPPTAAQIAELYRALRKGREDSKDEPGAADFYYGEMDMRREARDQRARDAWCKQPRDWGTWVAARTEHAILWLYWAVSGYALRAWRALLALLAVLLIATVLIATVGFPPSRSDTTLSGAVSGMPPRQTVRLEPMSASPASSMTTQQPLGPRLGTATLIALEGAVFRASELRLTYKGRLIQTVVRFIGPVLLALALLSVRGRVKR